MAPPKGQFGNRLDTAAGRAKEAQMAAAAQALVVAHSEAVHGRPEAAGVANALAQSTAANIPNAPAAFTQAVQRDAQKIQDIINPQITVPAPTNPGGGGGGSSGGGGTYTPPPPSSKPVNPWITTSNFVAPTGIKQADPDIVVLDTRPISPEYMLELEYESIAGMELINISRSDLINGQKVVYSPIKNLSLIRRRYNPNNIINLSELSASFFSRFAIDLVQRGMNDPYFDDEGNLIIEIDNVRDDEVIEVEIDTNATIEEVMFV